MADAQAENIPEGLKTLAEPASGAGTTDFSCRFSPEVRLMKITDVQTTRKFKNGNGKIFPELLIFQIHH
jgi:hypothetical protein